ncbi:hypothetical protein KEM55_002012 [Ascosphaera atra]|nr:hypothetical protein KEM55_002012 [Ascosphaera atra]
MIIPSPPSPLKSSGSATWMSQNDESNAVVTSVDADVPDIRHAPLSNSPSLRSRSSSPFRANYDDAQYRMRTLRYANIFIEEEVPTDISTFVNQEIFYDVTFDDSKLHPIAEELSKKAKELVEFPANEAGWLVALFAAIDSLKGEGLQIVYDGDWRDDLKPPVVPAHPTIPRKRSLSRGSTQSATAQTVETATTRPSSPGMPVLHLETPRPDICIGLSERSISTALELVKGPEVARRFLLEMGLTGGPIGDPHASEQLLRFPFLIVELKASATGGNLYQAQNEAAVGGSSALQILRGLLELYHVHLKEEGGDGCQLEKETHAKVVFSVTTEGPIYELWLHFQRSNGDFCMACIGAWRITLRDGALGFLSHLSAILRWGNGAFRNTVTNAIRQIYC